MENRIIIIFPKDSLAVFNLKSKETFGGATVQLFNITVELARRGLDVYALINNYNYEPELAGVNFLKTFSENDCLFIKIFKFIKSFMFLKSGNVVQRGLSLFSGFLALFCFFTGFKFNFMFAHDREVKGRYQKNNKFCFSFFLLLLFSKNLIVQNDHQHKILLNKKFINKNKIKRINSGYLIPDNKHLQKPKEFILWVSRLEPWKQPELFIDLAKEFSNEKFIMIAPEINGYEEYSREIKNKILDIPNLTRIPFVSYQEINEYFFKSKVFINTSIAEGFPNTFVQSAMNMSPILSLNVNPDNIFCKFSLGFFCNNDFNLMKERLKVLITDNNKWNELSEGAYNYSVNKHSIESTVSKFIDILK